MVRGERQRLGVGLRRAVGVAGPGQKVAEERGHIREVLGRAVGVDGSDRLTHPLDGAREVTPELVEVRGAGEDGQGRGCVGEARKDLVGLVVAAELDERVDLDRVRGRQVGEFASVALAPSRAARNSWRAAASVARPRVTRGSVGSAFANASSAATYSPGSSVSRARCRSAKPRSRWAP